MLNISRSNIAELTLAEAEDLVDIKMQELSFAYHGKHTNDLLPYQFEMILERAIDQVFSEIETAKQIEKMRLLYAQDKT